MQEESRNPLCKAFASGLRGTGRMSVKPRLGQKKALLGLCWCHSPPVFTFLVLGLVSGERDTLCRCVLSGQLSVLG